MLSIEVHLRSITGGTKSNFLQLGGPGTLGFAAFGITVSENA